MDQTFPECPRTHILLLTMSISKLYIAVLDTDSAYSAQSLVCFKSPGFVFRLLLHSAPWLHRPPACNSYSHQALSNSLSAEQTLSAELQRQSAR